MQAALQAGKQRPGRRGAPGGRRVPPGDRSNIFKYSVPCGERKTPSVQAAVPPPSPAAPVFPRAAGGGSLLPASPPPSPVRTGTGLNRPRRGSDALGSGRALSSLPGKRAQGRRAGRGRGGGWLAGCLPPPPSRPAAAGAQPEP